MFWFKASSPRGRWRDVGHRTFKVEEKKCEINTLQQLNKLSLTSPKLASHFAKQEADGQQAEGGGSAENTGSEVLQVFPETTSESLVGAGGVCFKFGLFKRTDGNEEPLEPIPIIKRPPW